MKGKVRCPTCDRPMATKAETDKVLGRAMVEFRCGYTDDMMAIALVRKNGDRTLCYGYPDDESCRKMAVDWRAECLEARKRLDKIDAVLDKRQSLPRFASDAGDDVDALVEIFKIEGRWAKRIPSRVGRIDAAVDWEGRCKKAEVVLRDLPVHLEGAVAEHVNMAYAILKGEIQ